MSETRHPKKERIDIPSKRRGHRFRGLASAMLFGWILWSGSAFTVASASPAFHKYDGRDGPFPYAMIDDLTLKDQERDRSIPLRIYYPLVPRRPHPVLLFSHGMGGSKASLNGIGRFLAGHGYVCIILTHSGSDSSLLDFSAGIRDRFEQIGSSFLAMKKTLDRPLDLSKVLDDLKEMEKLRPPLKGLLDGDRIGVVGHSFGAFTVLTMAGGYRDTLRLLYGRSYEDPRPRAFLAMSPPGTPPGIPPKLFYGSIDRPTMIMTGSRDDDPGGRGPNRAESRLDAFNYMPEGNKFALWIEGAYHHTFDPKEGQPKDPSAQKVIRITALAFFDAYLKSDPAGATFLTLGRPESLDPGRVRLQQK